ncbi:MAG: class I SAM-dependent methyltransferase [Solirubrobacterales bacterium]
MPAAPTATPERIRDANVRYHDATATGYDSKWGIDYGPAGQAQVVAKLGKALGHPPTRVGDALEIGAGTGYFTLNLLEARLIDRAVATDISPGMLAVLERSAAGLGVAVETVGTDAEQLPFADESFDLVFGHAVLHHIPDLRRAFAEFHRVLRPGGRIAFCGEPSQYGDAIAAGPKTVSWRLAPLWRRAIGAGPRPASQPDSGDELEWEVDVHAFAPRDLRRDLRAAGFTHSRVRGEELLANLYGWTTRTLEASANPDEVPVAWRMFAYRGYLALKRVDDVLEPRLPAELFYNLVLSARRHG